MALRQYGLRDRAWLDVAAVVRKRSGVARASDHAGTPEDGPDTSPPPTFESGRYAALRLHRWAARVDADEAARPAPGVMKTRPR
jgi:hypothetical protein